MGNPESLPENRKRSSTAAVVYGETVSKSGKERYLPRWSKQIDQDTAAAWFNNQTSKLAAVSSRFFNDPGLPRLDDGVTKRTCTFPHANANEKSTILCTSQSILSNTTFGDVSVKDDGSVVLKAKHPVFNIFHVPAHQFFAMNNNEDLTVEIDGIEDATIIINVQKTEESSKSSKSKSTSSKSKSAKSSKSNQRRSVYYSANYLFSGNCSSGQILVNLQHDANELVEIYAQPGQTVMPFSIMSRSDVKIEGIELQGQVMASNVYINGGNVTCPLFHGSYPCDVEKLHDYPF